MIGRDVRRQTAQYRRDRCAIKLSGGRERCRASTWMTESAELSDNSFRADYGAIIGKSNLIRYTHVVESSARGGNPHYSVKFAGTALRLEFKFTHDLHDDPRIMRTLALPTVINPNMLTKSPWCMCHTVSACVLGSCVPLLLRCRR